LTCDIVQDSFDNISQTERSTLETTFCFDANCMQSILTSTLCYQQPINSAARDNHTLIPLTVSYNEINLSAMLVAT